MADIYLAGGCFWGMEKYIASIKGVQSTQVGYANGKTANPTYEQVCHNHTGHAETVHVTYDAQTVPLPFLLDLFYTAIDPVAVNRQGGDQGVQYRSGIYYTDPADLATITDSIARLQSKLAQPVAIEVKPLENFGLAEAYHQKYLDKNPSGYCHIHRELFDHAAKAIVNPTAYTLPAQETLQKTLTPLQYEVTQHSATEPPFQNEHFNTFQPGIYVDITTGEPLFSSSDKFESGCGWPAFAKPIDPNVLHENSDLTLGRARTEVRSRVGDAHLGHVFEDGPHKLGGLRYCINSAALRFVPRDEMAQAGYGALLPLVDANTLT